MLLKNNKNFPWVLIVPEVSEEIEDLHQLSEESYVKVMQLVREASACVSAHFACDKLNVGCIGNQVRQMHIHIVGRFEKDAVWPRTVWTDIPKEPYSDNDIGYIVAEFIYELGLIS